MPPSASQALAERAGRDTDPKRWARARSQGSERLRRPRAPREGRSARSGRPSPCWRRRWRSGATTPTPRKSAGCCGSLQSRARGRHHGKRPRAAGPGRPRIRRGHPDDRPGDRSGQLVGRAAEPGHQLAQPLLLDKDPAWLESAIADYRAALTVRDPARDAARVGRQRMAGIGGTTSDLGEQRNDVALILEGRKAYLDARLSTRPRRPTATNGCVSAGWRRQVLRDEAGDQRRPGAAGNRARRTLLPSSPTRSGSARPTARRSIPTSAWSRTATPRSPAAWTARRRSPASTRWPQHSRIADRRPLRRP